MFPPTPESVAGALRAALARCNGWDGMERRWPPSLNPVLGDGPDDLGSLMFEGPLVSKTAFRWFLFPAMSWGSRKGNVAPGGAARAGKPGRVRPW